jgi:hypothetical protein
MCPPNPVGNRIAKDLPAMRSCVLKEAQLFLPLMADEGVYEFSPMGK